MATERSLERMRVGSFDLLLLHNPDRTGYESEAVWDGMAALRDAGLTAAIGVAPGPANGFTLDLIRCIERFGDRIDWAMLILNPLEPWPGELPLEAAARHDVRVITRVVDYGGLFWGDLTPETPMGERDHRRFRPDGWIEAGVAKLDAMRPIARAGRAQPDAARLRMEPLPPGGRVLRPTLIQEAGPRARPIEDKRAELAALPGWRLSAEDAAAIREIGDNTGSMRLKGANPEHEGPEAPDRWPLSDELAHAARRWQLEPERRVWPTPADLASYADSSRSSSSAAVVAARPGDQRRLLRALDRVLGDDALGDVAARGQLELDVQQRLLEDRPQAAGAGLALERLVGDRR